jgi:hypothetical protein
MYPRLAAVAAQERRHRSAHDQLIDLHGTSISNSKGSHTQRCVTATLNASGPRVAEEDALLGATVSGGLLSANPRVR